jgi:hypothetical protein
MNPSRILVFLPCHSLSDFPTWLDEADADALLAAWTAAWDPRLIAGVGRMPEWASVDLPPRDAGRVLGIVPAFIDERFAGQTDGSVIDDSAWVRGVTGRDALVAAARAAIGVEDGPIPLLAEDFHAVGLAWLIGELLARRMRSHSGIESSGFGDAVVAAARAAVAGDEATARERLQECFGALEAARSHYYPVDVWLVDLVLLSESTLGRALDAELASPVPLAVVATGRVIEELAARNPAALAVLCGRREAGTLAAVGGRHDARPLDLCTPLEIDASFSHGMQAWSDHAGGPPTTFGQIAGGSAPILPRLLADRGYRGAIWTLFDGTPLPDPGTSRIIWQGSDGGTIDGLGRAPLDARDSKTILLLAERIGDAMDHDHAAILQFAHYPGTASPWFTALRRIGGWSTVLGTFATPEEVLGRTSEAGVVVSFAADDYPVSLPREAPGIRAQIEEQIAAARRAPEVIAAAPLVADSARPSPAAQPSAPRQRGLARIFTRRHDDLRLVLDNGLVRVRVHETTGGILSVRRPGDRGNRMSQRLAVRWTRPAPPAGRPWESVAERAEYAAMVADSIDRSGDAIESRGRLTAADGTHAGSFLQRVRLVAGRPLAIVETEVQAARGFAGLALEAYVACQFAWHENEAPDVRRSHCLESIVTERWQFTAPHFIEIRTDAGRHGQSPTTIFPCGLPWHVRTSEHMLDVILPADDRPPATCRLAIGVGDETAAAVAVELLRWTEAAERG